MKKTLSVSTLSLVIASAGAVWAQNIPKSEALEKELDHRVTQASHEPVSIRDAFVEMLRGAHLPGGLELVHCGSASPLVQIKPNSSVREVVDEVAAAQHGLSLDVSDQVIDLRNTFDASSVLDVRIADIELPDIRHLQIALLRVLDMPEVRRSLIQFKLESRPHIGFSELPRPGTVPPPPVPLALHDVTLREALNVLARSTGKGVWIYDENRCSENGTVQVSFVVE